MAELEAFESRFHAAVRAYVGTVSSDRDPVELARAIATAEPRRRPWGLVAGRPLVIVPPPALLLLLAALVTLGMAAVLFAGGQRRDDAMAVLVPPAYRCPAGSTPDQPGPENQARPMTPMVRMAFDRDSGRIVAVTFATEDPAASWATWTFDVCTNTWGRVDSWTQPVTGAGILPDVVYDATDDLVVAIGGSPRAWGGPKAWTFDVDAATWAEQSAVPFTAESGRARLVHDPVSGLVFAQLISSGDQPAPPQELWTYDVAAGTWDLARQAGSLPGGPSGDHLLLAYDPVADRIVAVMAHPNRSYTRLFDPRTGHWTVGETGPLFNTGMIGTGGEIAWDEGLRRTVVISDGKVAAFDALGDEWEVLSHGGTPDPRMGVGPEHRVGHWMVYDPVNKRLVLAGGSYRTPDGSVIAGGVWAFDTATREWIELVPGSSAGT